jgi:6-phosphofructokinase 2
MIVTLTPNPSLDLLFSAERLVWDDANRIPMPRRRPGGQGINVVRAVRALDAAAPALALAPLGGDVGREMRSILQAEATPFEALDLDGETRVFVGVREAATGRALLLNPRGPAVEPAVTDGLLALLGRVMDAAPDGGWLACCGSLLPGMPADLYARAGAMARERGFRFVPDCDGEPLALAAPGADLLVPNTHEAERLACTTVRDPDSALAAASLLHQRTGAMVAVTLGEDGAVLVTAAGAWLARLRLPADLVADIAGNSAVGAGDAFLAALLRRLQTGEDPPTALVHAVAAGTATLLGTGTVLVRARDVERIGPHVHLTTA